MQNSKQWPIRSTVPKRLSSLFLILALLSGCETVLPVSDYCVLYEPIYHGPEDSEDTRGQIDRQNAIWLEICEEQAEH